MNHNRPLPSSLENGFSGSRAIADGQRREGTFVKPAPPMSAEEHLNAALKERKAQEELAKLSPLDRQIVESEKRLAAERADTERQKIRERGDFKAASERLDALEYFAKFDRHLAPVILEEIQHQRRVLFETLDVPAVSTNLQQLQQVALGQRQVANLQLRAAVDAAEQASQVWSQGLFFDEPPRRVIDSNQEFVIYKRKGQGLAIHAPAVEGKSDEQIAREYFPDTFNDAPDQPAA